MVDSDPDLLETVTPRHSLLSGRFKQSFAYLALRSRMPGIMQEIVAHFFEHEEEFIDRYGPDVKRDIYKIRDCIERLGRELQRDRQFMIFTGCEPDKNEWNNFILALPRPKRTFFRACWLHAECYLYRRMYSFVENSTYLKGHDYFADLKQEDVKHSVKAMEVLCNMTRGSQKSFKTFKQIMHFNLWSNRFELQLFNCLGESVARIWDAISTMERFILVDETAAIWDCLIMAQRNSTEPVIVDFVCDNAGFEFFVDMLLIEYLIDHNLASKVRLHVKMIPWYISDVTYDDIGWIIDFLKEINSVAVNAFGRKWEGLLKEGKIEIGVKSYFWTGPQSYFVMFDMEPELYYSLERSQLVIFKGDLNYRKLMGDYIWDSTEEFITCLRGFRPTNIAAMRTIKSEVVCGLPEGKADYLLKNDPQWMITGQYGLIQYTDSLNCRCALGPDVSNKLLSYSQTSFESGARVTQLGKDK